MPLLPCDHCELLTDADHPTCAQCGATRGAAPPSPSRAARLLGLAAVAGGALAFTPGCGYGAPPDYAEHETPKASSSASARSSASGAGAASGLPATSATSAVSAGASASSNALASASAATSAAAKSPAK